MGTTETLICLALLLFLFLINQRALEKRRALKELNHRIEFALKFVDPVPPEASTTYDLVIIQDLKEQCRITGKIKNGAIIQLTTTNDFIYEHYTGVELEKFILALFKHHVESPNEPLRYPLDGIKCLPMIPFDVND